VEKVELFLDASPAALPLAERSIHVSQIQLKDQVESRPKQAVGGRT